MSIPNFDDLFLTYFEWVDDTHFRDKNTLELFEVQDVENKEN